MIGLDCNYSLTRPVATLGLGVINESGWIGSAFSALQALKSLLSVSVVYLQSAQGMRMLLSDAADAAGLNVPARDLAIIVR